MGARDNCEMTLLAVSGPIVLLQLGLVLGALTAVLVWLGRRHRGGEPGIVQPIRLGPHHAVHIVTVEDRRLLIGTGPAAAPQLICDLAERPRGGRHSEPAANTPTPERIGLGGFGVAARPRGGWDTGG